MINFIEAFMLFLWQQSLMTLTLCMVILLVTFTLRKQHPILLLSLWLLIPIRLILPPYFSIDYALSNLFNEIAPPGTTLAPTTQPSLFTDVSELSDINYPVYFSQENVLMMLFVIWLVGFAFFMASRLIARAALRKKVRSSKLLPPLEQKALLVPVCEKLNFHQNVKIYISDQFPTVFTFGTLRPVICLPETIYKNASKQELVTMVSHEVCHVRAKDDLLLMLLNALQAIYFFHPAIWLARRQIIQQRERLVDRDVLASGVSEPKHYASTIVKIADYSQTKKTPLSAFGLCNQFQFIQQRIEGIKNMNNNHYSKIKLGLIAATVCLSGLFLPMQPFANNTSSNLASHTIESPIKTGRLSSKFGMRKHPVSGKLKFHKGVDIAAPKGTPVYAVNSGQVIDVVKKDKKRASYIVIQHQDGLVSSYSQLGETAVKVNDWVKVGQEIGKIGSPGQGTGPHLHFELVDNKKHIDPLERIADLNTFAMKKKQH